MTGQREKGIKSVSEPWQPQHPFSPLSQSLTVPFPQPLSSATLASTLGRVINSSTDHTLS